MADAQSAGLGRRLLSVVYEALLLAALLIAASLPVAVATAGMSRELARPLFQLFLVGLAGLYFTWQWTGGRRTLAMQTWRLRLVDRQGAPLTWQRAILRYLWALPGAVLFGAGFAWALVDRERLFLHDRLAGTVIVQSEA